MGNEQMFCYQCQETAKGSGCTVMGICGKSATTSNLQDKLIYELKRIGHIATRLIAKNESVDLKHYGSYVCEGLFSTITNANFDDADFDQRIAAARREVAKLEEQAKTAGVDFKPADGISYSILSEENQDVRSLKEMTKYGLKGLAAYAEHALRLGYYDEDIFRFVLSAMNDLLLNEKNGDQLTALVLETGSYGVKVMALLDKANCETYGNPEMTEVNIGVRNNPAILISGHDLKDMEMLLEQTAGTGVDVYTHSEMLPANFYPAFKKYDHFVGNYGNAWWKQKEEFETFNGPILFTTNCIVPPTKGAKYADKVFTTNSTGFPGFKYIPSDENGHKDFSEIIELAKTCAAPTEIEHGTIMGGFAHRQVMQLADKVVANIRNGSIRKFIVMSGCDGRMKGRDYYTDFAKSLPTDTIILTSGCAKYRYNKLELGDINGIPRVLDAGQCNDSYSWAFIALQLKEILGCEDINDLPIVFNVAWYEQKAVIVLLALLSLGVKNIHLGPTLPAFLSPNVAKVLVEQFGIAPIGTVDEDVALLVG